MNAALGPVGLNVGREVPGGSAEDTVRIPSAGPFSPPPGVHAAGDPAPAPFDPWHLLRALRRWWKVIGLLGLVGAGAATAAVLLLVPCSTAKYASYALIRVEPGESLPGSPQVRPELRDLRTQAELIKTPFVIRAALQTGPAADLPVVRADADAVLKRVTTDLKVEVVSPQLLRITLTGSDPAELPVLVDAVKEAYLREVVNGEQTRRARRKQFLEVAYRDCEKRSYSGSPCRLLTSALSRQQRASSSSLSGGSLDGLRASNHQRLPVRQVPRRGANRMTQFTISH